jgi:hypothetical protein
LTESPFWGINPSARARLVRELGSVAVEASVAELLPDDLRYAGVRPRYRMKPVGQRPSAAALLLWCVVFVFVLVLGVHWLL